MLTGQNIETMSALTLLGYPFTGRPVCLALAPLRTRPASCAFRSWRSVGDRRDAETDLTEFLALIERHRVTHTFLPPTFDHMLLAHEDLFLDRSRVAAVLWWSGSHVRRSPRGGHRKDRPGDAAQLFGQTEAPMISTMAPDDHFPPTARSHASGCRRPDVRHPGDGCDHGRRRTVAADGRAARSWSAVPW